MLLAPLAVALGLQLAPDPPPARPRVLFFTHSAGFVHPVVERAQQAVLAHAERCFVELAEPMFEVEVSQDCAALRADQLPRYQALVFYTTGELPLAPADKDALLAFVAGGRGFVGVHCATDTFYGFPEFGAMLGGYFDGHPWHQAVRLAVEDSTHPATFHLGAHVDIEDEIYQFRDWSRERVQVLLRLTDHGIDLRLGKRADGDYAVSWCREHGRGRVFYTALGHRPEVWRDPRFTSHLLAGLRWTVDRDGALGRAPEGATVLLGGRSALRPAMGDTLGWQAAEGGLEVVPGTHDALSAEPFGDLRAHIEFQVPADAHHGNSGVYVQRRYEVQILDSFGEPAQARGCGALYGVRAPDFNASRPVGEWQSFDLWFRAARFAGEDKVANARITLLHNGIVVHRDVELSGPTGRGLAEGSDPQPLALQEHGSRVRFRNVWVLGAW